MTRGQVWRDQFGRWRWTVDGNAPARVAPSWSAAFASCESAVRRPPAAPARPRPSLLCRLLGGDRGRG